VSDSGLAPGIDPTELSARLETFAQGDLLDVGKIVFLWSPDAPAHPGEVDGVPHEEPLMTQEMRLPSGLCVIVSQDCDLRRLPGVEPYVFVCPLTAVNETAFKEAADGMSVRYFAYPEINGHEGERLVVDGRLIQSIEKTALLSTQVEHTPCPLPELGRAGLRFWLGCRLGRDVFPDEIVRQVVQPIEKAVKQARSKDQEKVFQCVIWAGFLWTPGKRYCSLLLLTDPALRAQHRVEHAQIDLMLGRLRKSLAHFAGKAGGHSITVDSHDATEVSGSTLLQHYELALDLDVDLA
jgi:hypothetical protein